MKKILFISCILAAILITSCGGKDKSVDSQNKSLASIDLKAFINLLNKPFSSAQATFKNNKDTLLQVADSDSINHNVLVVYLNDNSVANATPVLGLYESEGNVVECDIFNINSAVSQTETALGTEYGNLAEKTFGEVYGALIAKYDATSALQYWTKLQDLWDYINQNGYSGFDEYQALWVYNGNSCLLNYNSSPQFFLEMLRGDITVAASSSSSVKLPQKVTKAIRLNR